MSDTCGCCEPASDELDPHVNPPGRATLAYRIGDWARLRERLLAGLSRQALDNGRRPLAALTSRSPDDPTVALLDAAAVLGDVLTLYQERIANEHYLRTATERRSGLELARMIGYELRPGVSAGVDLVVEVEDAPGAPGTAEVPAGTRVTSVPAAGALPQTFETAAPLLARASWNALRPRQRRPQRLAIHKEKLFRLLDDVEGDPADAPEQIPAAELFEVGAADDAAPPVGALGAEEVDRVELAGTATRLQPGDRLLAVGRTAGDEPKVATLMLVVAEIVPDPARDRTVVVLAVPRKEPKPGRPPTLPKPAKPLLGFLAPFTADTVREQVVGAALTASTLNVLLLVNRWTVGELVAHVATVIRQPPGTPGLFAFRERAGVFGATAPAYATLPDTANIGPNWDTTNGWPIWKNHGQGVPDVQRANPELVLERPVRGAGPRSWAVVEQAGEFRAYQVTQSAEVATTGFAMSGRGTGLTLTDPDGTGATRPDTFLVRSTTVHVASEALRPAELIVDTPLDDAGEGVTTLALDGFQPDLAPGQRVAVSGEQLDAAGVIRHEVAEIKEVVHEGGVTYLALTARLRHRYVRDSVTLSANVVRASHGGTEVEVLGSGDATLAHQRFVLRKPPVTHLPVPPTGAVPALEIRVDGVAWDLADSLHDAGPDDQRYLLRRDDDGRTTVVFGDGRHGARLPTGAENVVAVYRSGIGAAGEVTAGSLTQLQTKPLGVRSVRNPVAAAGAQDPEARDSARENAPRQVATFGRIVSRSDAEQFVRGFPGIGKAQAAVVAVGPTRRLVVAAATATGLPVDESADTVKALREALRDVAEPSLGVLLVGYRDRPFDVGATLAVAKDRFRFPDVAAAGRAALLDTFGFARRQFAEGVSAAEVVTVLAGVPGVLGVDLNVLARAPAPDDAAAPAALLVAEPTGWDDGPVAPELLTVNPLGITLDPMPEAEKA